MTNSNHPSLEELFEKWRAQAATPEERAAFQELIEATNADSSLAELLKKEWENRDKEALHFTDNQSRQLLENILQKSKKNNQPMVGNRYKLGWMSIAASVLVVATIGTLPFIFRTIDSTSISTINIKGATSELPILPGNTGAILTLSNGEKIALNAATNGKIASEENVIITKEDGILNYASGNSNSGPIQYHTMTTPNGGFFQLHLPDGTKVWLNAASSIKYPSSFSAKERLVELSGEAYFEVATDRNSPFYVVTENCKLEILGTHFNLNAYSNEPVTKTTLLEGSVKVTSLLDNNSKSLLLEPGQQAQLNVSKNQLLLAKNINSFESIAWKRGILQFEDADIATIMRQIERWYDVKVVYQGSVPKRSFTGEITREASVNELLKILTLSDISFKVTDKTITVIH